MIYRSSWILKPLMKIYFKRINLWKSAFPEQFGELQFLSENRYFFRKKQKISEKKKIYLQKINFSFKKDLESYSLFCKKNNISFRILFMKDLKTKNLVVQISDSLSDVENVYIKKM